MTCMAESARVDCGPAPTMLRTRDLCAAGWSRRTIASEVASGRLIRLRGGAFCAPETPDDCVAAGRSRGRLTCVSELRRRGVFVLERTHVHIHVPETSSRLPAPRGTRRIHRAELHRTPHPRSLSVTPFDALLHAVLCQPPRAALATLDSALHHGLLRYDELDELFSELPRRFRSLRRLVDPRAESGSETLMRLILRSLGCAFDVQVKIVGVGRVDFLVDGWLIVECDSKAFHSRWEDQLKDRRRDQDAAARGYATYRPVAEDIMWHADVVRSAVAGLIRARRR